MRSLLRSISRAFIYRVPGERETCPACGSPRLYELDLLPLRRAVNGQRTGFISGCNACGLVFSNPQPSVEELAHLYSPEGAWKPRRHGESGNGADVLPSATGRTWSRMFDPIRPELSVTAPPPGAAVLDFGCGSGALLDALQDCGWETWGIESADDYAFRRHRRLVAVPGEPTFDLIIANHVLEHVTDPLGLLREFARACRRGGYVLVCVPRLDTLPRHRDYKYIINGRAHITAYTWACLRGLLARAGWMPVARPPDRISKGRGRRTSARLRVVARRVDAFVELPVSPADEARSAMRRYHATVDGRSMLERLRLYRFAARRAEARRRQNILTRKSDNARRTAS